MFTKGDFVWVVMDRNDVFPWQDGPGFEAVFQYGPQGAGDTFHLLVAGPDAEDMPLVLNGNSNAFIGIMPIRAYTP
jgi:hypothetical protein